MTDKFLIMRMVAWIAGYCLAYSRGRSVSDAAEAAYLADSKFKDHFKTKI